MTRMFAIGCMMRQSPAARLIEGLAPAVVPSSSDRRGMVASGAAMDEACGEHEARYVRFGRAYAAALLTADEVAAELAIRDAVAAKLTTAEIDEEIIAP